MPTYSIVSQGSEAHTATGASIAPAPGTHATGDLLLLFVGCRTLGASITTPTGYDLLVAGSNTSFAVYGKLATSSSESSPTVATSGSSVVLAFITVLRSSTGWPSFSGVPSAIVIDQHASNSSGASNTKAWYPSLTVTQDNLLKVAACRKLYLTSNAATSVALSSGWDSQIAVKSFLNAGSGVWLAGQVQGQTTKTDNVDLAETVTGNTDSVAVLGVTFTLSGNQSSVAGVAPGVGATTFSGLAPSILGARTLAPGVGALSIQGLALQSQPGQEAPGLASLALAGLAPQIIQQTGPNAGIGTGILVLNGLDPTLITSRTISPSLVTSAGDSSALSPTVLTEWTAKPAPASLTLAGTAIGNLIKDGTIRLVPDPAALSVQGLSVTRTVPFDGILAPGRATLDYLGLAPNINQNWILAPQKDQDALDVLAVLGYAPSLSRRFNWHTIDDAAAVTWHPE